MTFFAEDNGQRASVELDTINGDLVISINGERIPTDYIRIIQDSPGDYVKIELVFYPTSLKWKNNPKCSDKIYDKEEDK